MRVLFVTTEYATLAKAGGLADVSAALPAALRALGIDVRVLIPGYPDVLAKAGELKVSSRFNELGFDCRVLEAESLLVLDCAALYRRGGGPYQDPGGQDWPDNALRFGLLSRVAARLATGFDVVHCHDWPAALTAVFLKKKNSLFTIHNLAFQGSFERSWLARLGLAEDLFSFDQLEFHGRVSFLKGALVHAGAITAVSPTYAREIQSEEFGCGMDGVLRERRAVLTGILNGIDTAVWDPAADPHLAERYDASSLDRKKENKAALQRRLNLEVDPSTPLIGFVGRLTHQKGADLIAAALAEIPGQVVVLGKGEREMENALVTAAARHPGRVAVAIGFDEELA